MTDEFITDHRFQGLDPEHCGYVYPAQDEVTGGGEQYMCNAPSAEHAVPGEGGAAHGIYVDPHDFVPRQRDDGCGYRSARLVCGYPEEEHLRVARERADAVRRTRTVVVRSSVVPSNEIIKQSDIAQYARPPMPDEARRGPTVTLIDAPVDPLGTLAVLGGIYKGEVYRSKSEVTDEQRRGMLADMAKTALSGPLESIQFTFLVEGIGRDITHQMVRSRFSFFAQESLRFAVADDWAQEVPLPPSLAGMQEDAPAVGVWRKALNQAEASYNALIGAGMAAEEARKVLPHAITTRLFWVMDLRTMLLEAGKRTCTQAQFEWRQIFAGVARALRERGEKGEFYISRLGERGRRTDREGDGWQYRELAKLMRPMCYQEGACKMMASFDRGCTIRERVTANAVAGRPSSEWHIPHAPHPADGIDPIVYPPASLHGDHYDNITIPPIYPSDWAADPAAARVREGEQ